MEHLWTTATLLVDQDEPLPCGHEDSEGNNLTRGKKRCLTCLVGRGTVDVEVRIADPERWEASQEYAASGRRYLAHEKAMRSLRGKAHAVRKRRKHGAIVNEADYAAILAEFGMVCHICGLEIKSMKDLHFDHVIPLAKEGPHSRKNIKPAHSTCNLRKHTKNLDDYLAQKRLA
jgi:hypothetical protein